MNIFTIRFTRRVRKALAAADRVREEIARRHAGHETADVTTWEDAPMERLYCSTCDAYYYTGKVIGGNVLLERYQVRAQGDRLP